jgi:hypothetical protein
MNIPLTPEMEANLTAEAAARGISIEGLFAEALNAYLGKSQSPDMRRVPFQDRRAEMRWVAHPDPQYVGKWVVLEGARVIASSSEPVNLYEEVRSKGILSPFLVFVPPEDHRPLLPGWLD